MDATWLTSTRDTYDLVAADYADLLENELDAKPLDRALLSTFNELVIAGGGGPIGDLGCGPGRVTAHLDDLGADVFGLDLSPGMIAEARRRHPRLRFAVGSMLNLPIEDESLGGVLAWYSIIHTPTAELPQLFSEFFRVLRPGGCLLLAFQIGGGEHLELRSGYGHEGFNLVVHRRSPVVVTEFLVEAGFERFTSVEREPIHPEKSQQAYLMMSKRV